MSWSYRRLASGGLAALIVPLLMLFAPSGIMSAEQASPAGGAWQVISQSSNGIVPDVTYVDAGYAIQEVQAAGFVVQTRPGWVDCSSSPYVQFQSPAGGTSAPLGSTVFLYLNQQPGPGQDCP